MGKYWMVERTEYDPEKIERRYHSLDQRKSLYPTDLSRVSQIAFDRKFGRSESEKLLAYLEKTAPNISAVPTTHSLIGLLFEASLDCRLAVYDELNRLVSLFRDGGDLREIDEKITNVAKMEEVIRRQKQAEDQQDYNTRVRIEAIKAVFKP